MRLTTSESIEPPDAKSEGPFAERPGEQAPEALLDQYLKGDDGAFTALVDRVGPRLYGFVCRFLRGAHTAEDAYQTVLIKVARHAATYDRRAQFTTWLYRVARNTCLDVLRQEGRQRVHSLDATSGEADSEAPVQLLTADAPAPGERLEAEELRERIAAAVTALPDDQREVFLLKEDAELTFEEIGELLGCGKETAKSRMRYALRRLQNTLGREGREYGLLEPQT